MVLPEDRDFPLPPFYCPWDSALHPDTAELEHRSRAWLEGQAFAGGEPGVTRLMGTRSAEFYARIAPEAKVDAMQVAVDWCYWGFAFDDARCDGVTRDTPSAFVALANQAVRVIETRGALLYPGDPYLVALADLAERMGYYATEPQMMRWAHAHRVWLMGAAWQLAETRLPVSLADYFSMRLGSCAGAPTTAMIEIVEGGVIPAAELDSPLVRAVTEMTWLIAAIDNDLVSARKELATGQADHNLVTVLAADRRCSAADAAEATRRIRDRIMVRFLRLRDVAYRPGSAELRGYLTDLANLIRGNVEWSLAVPRYNSADQAGRSSAAPTLVWADRPADAGPEPLPYPAISWWWDRELG